MIKSTAEVAAEVYVSSFPKLMINISNTYIVLFKKAGEGVIVWTKLPTTAPVATYSKGWGMDDFTSYKGKITLETSFCSAECDD